MFKRTIDFCYQCKTEVQAHLDDMKKERESVKVNERKRTLTREDTEVEGQKRKTLMLLFNRQIIMLKELKAVVT